MRLVLIQWGKMMQTVLLMRTTENKRIITWKWLLLEALRWVASGPQLLFLHQRQNIREWQQQFKEYCVWNNFWRNVQQKNSIAIREHKESCIKLCQIPVMQKRSQNIETKFHLIRINLEDETIFSKSSPYHIEGGNISNCSNGNRLYAISSSLSGGLKFWSNFRLKYSYNH